MGILEGIIGVEEAAKILGLSPGTVKNKAAASQIPAKNIGNRWIFAKTELEEWKMSTFNKLNARNGSTIVVVNGVEYRTIDQPYVLDSSEQYRAEAVDSEDKRYIITWDVNHPDFENLEDESEACDWDHPVNVEAI